MCLIVSLVQLLKSIMAEPRDSSLLLGPALPTTLGMSYNVWCQSQQWSLVVVALLGYAFAYLGLFLLGEAREGGGLWVGWLQEMKCSLCRGQRTKGKKV